MASVSQRCPALVLSPATFRKPEVRCAATGNGDGLHASDKTQIAELKELKLTIQPKQDTTIEIDDSKPVTKLLSDFKDKIKDKSPGELAFYGGIAGVGLAIGGSVLTSLELLPMVPEALQVVGIGYSVLIASRMMKGKKNLLVRSSPFKAISELVENKDQQFQRTTIVLPRDMDETVRQVLEKLAMERDAAVNKVEELKKATTQYARVVAEKEALEAVAMELVKERDSAISEVSGLKKAVEAMQGRISSVELVLAREVQQIKQQNEALEAAASQLATERDSAMRKVEELKQLVSQVQRSDDEKRSLEEVAFKLTSERDRALAELDELKKVVANLNMNSGLTPEQEIFIKDKVRGVKSQYIDIAQGYDAQKEEVHKFVSHLVDEYGAPREWTLNYMKQVLDSKFESSTIASD